MSAKEKIIIIGSGGSGQDIAALAAKYHQVEFITPEQAQEQGLQAQYRPVYDLKPQPILSVDYPFTPPLTRAQRRKNNRNK